MKLKNMFAAVVAMAIMTQTTFAQNSGLIVLKKPTKVLNVSLAHAGQIKVRAILNDLNPGDYVSTLEVDVRGGQLGSKLELFADQTQLGSVTLFGQFRKEFFKVKLRNGIDYQKLTLRSIGSSVVQRVTAVVADPNSDQDDEQLPPPPPPPDAQPPVVIIAPPPVQHAPPIAEPGLNQFNANCKTRSNGITFYASSEQGAFGLCANAVSFYNTNSGECYAMSECNVPEMQCTSSGAGIPVVAYSRDAVIQKCKSHPAVISAQAGNQCEAFARCQGSNNNGPIIVQPPQPPISFAPSSNEFDPNKPCQTKSNGYKFSAFSRGDVVARCSSFSPAYTDRTICRDNSFCGEQQGGGPFDGGHFGPLPNQSSRCISFSQDRIFTGGSIGQVIDACNSNFPNTSNIECNQNSYCANNGDQACLSFSRNRPFFSNDREDAAQRCRSHGSTDNDQCNQTSRCY